MEYSDPYQVEEPNGVAGGINTKWLVQPVLRCIPCLSLHSNLMHIETNPGLHESLEVEVTGTGRNRSAVIGDEMTVFIVLDMKNCWSKHFTNDNPEMLKQDDALSEEEEE